MPTLDTAARLALLEHMHIDCGEITKVELIPGKAKRTFLKAEYRGYGDFFAVHMVLHSAPGSSIRSTLGLPAENWNGRFLFLGSGGAAGSTGVGDLSRGMALGYATAHTAMGTTRDPYSCIGSLAVLRDFGGVATHLTTVVCQQITEAFYGKAPEHSYFFGGSTGGQQAMQEAQRYPEDYDGILCFHPAFDRVRLHLQFVWNLSLLNSPAPEDRLTAQELHAVTDRLVLEYAQSCGGAPGDNFLAYPDRIGEIDFSIFQDSRMALPLTDAKVETLRKIYAGPTDPVTGERYCEGMTPGAECQPLSLIDALSPESFIKSLLFPFYWAYGRGRDYLHADFHQDAQQAIRDLSPILDATDTDLSPFRDRGGRLLLVHGTADGVIPWRSSVRYYTQVAEKNGGFENTQKFFRFFLVPGYGHGVGGPRFQDAGITDYAQTPLDPINDPLLALDEWVTSGKAPEKLLVRGFENGDLRAPVSCCARPVYPYPVRTRYVSGDVNDPGSFAEV